MSHENENSIVWPQYVPKYWRLNSSDALKLLASTNSSPSKPLIASDMPKCHAVYVKLSDGVKLAVDYWLPKEISAGERVPAVLTVTRYWRSLEPIQRKAEYDTNARQALEWARQGFAYIIVDPRGSGASFGSRKAEHSAEEMRNTAEMVEWAAQQKWCNGWIATEGGSYAGNAAELACVHNPRGLGAVIGRYTDFHGFETVGYPGGIHNLYVLLVWSALTRLLDGGDASVLSAKGASLEPKRVDHDIKGEQRAKAIAEHRYNFNIGDEALKIEFSDDSAGDDGASRNDVSLISYRSDIEKSRVPQFVLASWLDAATADGALQRFCAMPNLPMRVVIGAWSHMTANPADPYGKLKVPDLNEQISEYAEFLKGCIHSPDSFPPREIRYYTLNEDRWRSTEIWPPKGHSRECLYFSADRKLSRIEPEEDNAHDHYDVDFSASTGLHNRWRTQVGGGAVIYGDRRNADEKLLCYTSAPLDADCMITGYPLVTLHLSTNKSDASVFCYLEEVAPDGKVTYLTEGELRALHRRSTHKKSPNPLVGPYRRFLKRDAQHMKPGEPAELSFRMLPVSVLVSAGHSLRVAIAGADADTFAIFPDTSPQRWTLHRSITRLSKVEIPVIRKSALQEK